MTDQRTGTDRRGDTVLAELLLCVKTYNALKRAGVETLADLVAIEPATIRKIRGMGQRSVIELLDVLGDGTVPDDWRAALLLDASTVGGLKVPPSQVVSPYVVYFIECSVFVKIGLTSDVNRRLCVIQTSTPFAVDLVGAISRPSMGEALAVEKALHRQFAQFHHRNEWFRYEGELRDYVEGLRAAATE